VSVLPTEGLTQTIEHALAPGNGPDLRGPPDPGLNAVRVLRGPQEGRRRLPRHLRVRNQRRRNNGEDSPMPLFAAVASPELAGGKVWIDSSQFNKTKESGNFLSVDELLEQQEQPKQVTPATEVIVGGSENSLPLGFITQPANESVEKKVQESLPWVVSSVRWILVVKN